MKKRKILIALTALLVFTVSLTIIIGCSEKVDETQDKGIEIDSELKNIINSYIAENEAHLVRGGKAFAEHELYGTEKKDEEVYVYLWAYFKEYYLESDKLKTGGGGSYPLVIVLLKDNSESYKCVRHYSPGDGSYYVPSIEDLFPEEYHEAIFNRPDVDKLSSLVEQKARDHYNKEK